MDKLLLKEPNERRLDIMGKRITRSLQLIFTLASIPGLLTMYCSISILILQFGHCVVSYLELVAYHFLSTYVLLNTSNRSKSLSFLLNSISTDIPLAVSENNRKLIWSRGKKRWSPMEMIMDKESGAEIQFGLCKNPFTYTVQRAY